MISNLTSQLSSTIETHERNIANMTSTHQEDLLNVQVECQDEKLKTINEAYEIENSIKRDMEQMQKDVDALIASKVKKAKAENERVVQSAQREVDSILEEVGKTLEQKEEEISALQSSSSKSDAEYRATIEKMAEEIEGYKILKSMLERDLYNVSTQLDYWVEVGTHPTYVNTTLLYVDGMDNVDRVKVQARDAVCKYGTVVVDGVRTSSGPYVQKVQKFYVEDSGMKEKVDLYVVPQYDKHIVPVWGRVRSQIKRW